MAAILKTDLYSKLERLGHWKLSLRQPRTQGICLRCANANSISRRQRKQKTEKEGFKTLDLSGQCNKMQILLYQEMRYIGPDLPQRSAAVLAFARFHITTLASFY